jgi:hypothetical protein
MALHIIHVVGVSPVVFQICNFFVLHPVKIEKLLAPRLSRVSKAALEVKYG